MQKPRQTSHRQQLTYILWCLSLRTEFGEKKKKAQQWLLINTAQTTTSSLRELS